MVVTICIHVCIHFNFTVVHQLQVTVALEVPVSTKIASNEIITGVDKSVHCCTKSVVKMFLFWDADADMKVTNRSVFSLMLYHMVVN